MAGNGAVAVLPRERRIRQVSNGALGACESSSPSITGVVSFSRGTSSIPTSPPDRDVHRRIGVPLGARTWRPASPGSGGFDGFIGVGAEAAEAEAEQRYSNHTDGHWRSAFIGVPPRMFSK